MRAVVFWFSGLSGAGKSTVAQGAKALLEREGRKVLVLDGDEIRQRLHAHFDFSPEGIVKNNAAVACLCQEQRGLYDIICVSIISPYRRSREAARALLEPSFYEVYFCADLATVAARDVKGLYAKAKAKLIKDLIGYSEGAVYEPPQQPDLSIDSSVLTPDVSISQFYQFVLSKT